MAQVSRRSFIAGVGAIPIGASALSNTHANSQLTAFRDKFRIEELKIDQNRSWTWSVRPSQPTIGSTVLSLNRHCPAFGELNADEGRDLSAIVATTERRLREVLGPQRINYLMLMMVDHHVHFHVIPRYEKQARILDLDWPDAAWPSPPDLSVDLAENQDDLLLLLRAALSRQSDVEVVS